MQLEHHLAAAGGGLGVGGRRSSPRLRWLGNILASKAQSHKLVQGGQLVFHVQQLGAPEAAVQHAGEQVPHWAQGEQKR